MVDTALRAAGHRSARYTSPHLVELNERFVIDGQPVGDEALVDAITRPEERKAFTIEVKGKALQGEDAVAAISAALDKSQRGARTPISSYTTQTPEVTVGRAAGHAEDRGHARHAPML